MNGAIISVLVSILVHCIGLASGLSCFMCSKINNDGPDWGCDANVINPDAKECKANGAGVPMCHKTTATIKVDENDFNLAIRGCFTQPEGTKERCILQFDSNYNATSYYCICKTDDCNGHGDPFRKPDKNNPAPKISLAHFGLPLIGFAFRLAQEIR